MFEGKHIHYSPLSKRPLCSFSAKLCHQRRLNGFAFVFDIFWKTNLLHLSNVLMLHDIISRNVLIPFLPMKIENFVIAICKLLNIAKEGTQKKKKGKRDTFNSDDPYAFPDTISDHENGCIGFSQTSILRSAWNCSQKSLPDASSVDSPLRCDQPSKIAPSNECKLKSNTPTLSQTMNRLHAKIAQNKLLDKQKKIQDSSLNTISLINAQLQAISNLKCDDPMSPTETNSINSESNDAKRISEIIKDDVLIKCDSLGENGRSEDSITSNFVSSPNPPSITQGDSRMSSGMNSCSSDKYFCEPLTPPAIDSLSDFSPKDFSCKEKLEDETVIERMDDTVIEKPKILDNSKTPIVLRKLQRIFKKKKRQNKYIFPSAHSSFGSYGQDNSLNYFPVKNFLKKPNSQIEKFF
ncbi:INO80 complex subunit D [Caerostris extrusa]|uniref:INO80 complex subunit D n=1 Tax=Caerostris extrusa TaxID=172846 RepID=A0AAV4M569_CAEEX|nr:INO80 complex subunit D [Caerostris extrusa]